MELLSPAGTLESFYAAISNGADAIYLGLDKFSARAYATNFTLENLKPLVDFAHLRNVRIFVTINTILYDDELIEAFNAIDQLAKMNVDAIIVQDLAILDYITRKYKSLEAHASTQMGVDDIEGTKLLKDLGVTRVVYARETPIEILKNIKKSVNIEIETFIHGALCVSYSGNCLM
ncbi:MAG: peptidase U32 family protein, partial [Candidatus Onthovivens sp.]